MFELVFPQKREINMILYAWFNVNVKKMKQFNGPLSHSTSDNKESIKSANTLHSVEAEVEVISNVACVVSSVLSARLIDCFKC